MCQVFKIVIVVIIRDILVGVVILTVIFLVGLLFGVIVLADGIFGLFGKKKDISYNNDIDIDDY